MKTQLLKKTGKQLIALLMSVIMIFSMLPLTAMAAESTDEVGDAFSDGAKSFGISKLYSTGLLAVGKMITSVADSTGNEEFSAAASAINTWVCGGNNTAKSLAEIEALCNEILTEVKAIDNKLDAYSADIEKILEDNKLTAYEISKNNAWAAVYETPLKQYSSHMSTALDLFFNPDDFENNGVLNEDTVSYLAAAISYRNNEPINGHIFTKNEVEKKRTKLFNVFCQIAGLDILNGTSGYDEKIYTNSAVDKIFLDTIQALYAALNSSSPDYGQECAKCAYVAMPDLSDQYDYVIQNINKHFMSICMVEMLYQEYLSMRGEYLEKNHPDDIKLWENYNRCVNGDSEGAIDGLADKNNNILIAMGNYLNRTFVLGNETDSNSPKIKLTQYPSPEDSKGVVLHNTKFMSSFTGYDYVKEPVLESLGNEDFYKGDNYISYYDKTSEYMSFYKNFSYSNNKMEKYYVLAGDKDSLSMKNLVFLVDVIGADEYFPSCDFYNLTKGSYTDGSFNYSCAKAPKSEASLFKNDSYTFCKSIMYNYMNLNKLYTAFSGEEKVYQIFPDYSYKDAVFTTAGYVTLNGLDITTENANLDVAETTKFKANDDIYNAESPSYYTVILQSDEQELKSKVSSFLNNPVEENNVGENSDIYITKTIINEDGSSKEQKIANDTLYTCGETLTLHFKASDGYVLDSLKLCRYNDAKNPNSATSEVEIVQRSDFDTLEYDSKTQYYSIDFTVPYSNCALVLDVIEGYEVKVDDIVENELTLDADKTVYKAGETVNFTCKGKVETVFEELEGIEYSESGDYIDMTYNASKNISTGSFTMPANNVILRVNDCSFMKLPQDSQGNYTIKTYKELCDVSTAVNSGAAKFTEAKYILINNISFPDNAEWTPISVFKGTFEGSYHTISNINTAGNVEEFGLFGHVKNDAVIQNLKLTNVNLNIGKKSINVAPLCVENYGIISNCSTSGKIVAEYTAEPQTMVSIVVGGICAVNAGKITDSYNECSITWNNSILQFPFSELIAGGIAGKNYANISRCYNTADITFTGGKNTYLGGLVGMDSGPTIYMVVNQNFMISDSYNTGNIGTTLDLSTIDDDEANAIINELDPTGEYNLSNNYGLSILIKNLLMESCFVCGLVSAELNEVIRIENCYNIGNAYSKLGVFYEAFDFSQVRTETNCYYLVSDDTKITSSAMKYKSQFESGDVAYDLNSSVTDGSQAWYQNLDNGLPKDNYPVLTNNEQNTVYIVSVNDNITYSNTNTNSSGDIDYIIKTYDDLYSVAYNISIGNEEYIKGKYILANNINAYKSWNLPIGTKEHPFEGTFDGRGYTISGLTLSYNANEGNSGLFGKVNGGTIKNLNLSNMSMNGKVIEEKYEYNLAILCADIVNGTITNCNVNGSIDLSAQDHVRLPVSIGGICAYAESATIEKCVCSVSIKLQGAITSDAIGGICVYGDAKINNCAYTSSINASNADEYGIGSVTSISNCYSTYYNTYRNKNSIGPSYSNCYYLIPDNIYITDSAMKHKSQFASGEVTYLLNNGVTDGTQAWYQNLDNGKSVDVYPVVTNNNVNTVYKIDSSDKAYSNYEKYKVNVDNQTDSELTFDSGETNYEKGETVSFTCTGYIASVYKEVNNDSQSNEYIHLTYDSDKNISTGSFTMPSSGVTLKLYEYKVSVDNQTESVLSFDAGKSEFTPYENVSITCTGNVIGVWKELDGVENSGEYLIMKYDSDKNISTASFTMPANDVTIKIDESSINSLSQDDAGNFIIKTYDDLCSMATLVNLGVEDCVNGNYILANNIDCSEEIWDTPIGTSSNPFKGTFDGQNYTISGLQLNKITDDGNRGLFGEVNGGTIKNLNLSNMSMNGEVVRAKRFKLAILCANIVNGTITNCNVDGSIDLLAQGDLPVSFKIGVICACAETTTIEKCISSVSIKTQGTIDDDIIAGVCAFASGAVKINNCAYTSSINDSGSKHIYGIGDAIFLTNCYSTYYNTSYNWYSIGLGYSNCYYLIPDDYDRAIIFSEMKYKSQFASGEVTYLLNNGVTDGTQAWYQNIDNGETPDEYPVLDSTHGTVYCEKTDTYSNSDKREPDEFEADSNGYLIISTYDDLVKLAKLVRSDYELYGSQNYILTDNIIIPNDSKWEYGIGSVEENKPFNGTFDGNGYIISGLNVAAGEYGGLFEFVGEKGKVSQILTLSFDFDKEIKTAGAIAAVNNGVIDHCISGANLTAATIFIDWNLDGINEKIIAAKLNSSIRGETSGGIVAVNNGEIIGCRNASIISETKLSGGIAAVNNGTITGCANTGAITPSNAEAIGGIAGKNTGCINASYNAGKMNENSDENRGSVVGINESENVNNVFYRSINGLKDIGTASSVSLNDTNVLKNKDDMMSDDFVAELNKVTNNSDVLWTRSQTQNNGYPIIQCQFYKLAKRISRSGISVTGKMHKDLNVEYSACNDNCEESALYENYGKVISVYDVDITDRNGNKMLQELWSAGEMEVSVPVSDDNVRLLTVDNDGNVSEVKYTMKNGNAVFSTEKLQSIALVSAAVSETDKNVDNKNTGSISAGDNTFIKTGSTVLSLASVAIIVMFAALVFIKRRKYND